MAHETWQHRLPKQGWREKWLLIFTVMPTNRSWEMERKYIPCALPSCFQSVNTYSEFLETGAILGDSSFQVLKHVSPETQPAGFVSKVVKWLIYRNILHSIFSFHSPASVVYIHFMKTSSIYLHSFFRFPLLFTHKETAKRRRTMSGFTASKCDF